MSEKIETLETLETIVESMLSEERTSEWKSDDSEKENEETRVVNLTPHVVRLNDGTEYPPSGTVARVSTKYVQIRKLGSIPIYKTDFGNIVGLPEPEDGVIYVVSGMIASATPDRDDVVSPATGHPDAVRRDGQVWSVPGFSKG